MDKMDRTSRKMTGRVMIVTGANSGIGFEVARHLAEGGNDVVLACRDRDKGKAAIERIREELPNSLVQHMGLDLSSYSSIKDFVKEFTSKKKKLNVLVNNAAMSLNFKDLTRKTTGDGNELTMATNHLGPFLLGNLLMEHMIQTASIMGEGRIINVTCKTHNNDGGWQTRGVDILHTDNFQLQKENTFNGMQAYKNSKLCNVLATYFMSEHELRGTGVTVNAIDPGLVPKTELERNASSLSRLWSVCCLHNMLRCTHITKTSRQAAREIVDLALSDKYEGKSGKFFCDGIEDRSSIESYDIDLQRDVWKLSKKLVNLRTSMDDEDFDDISLGTGPADRLLTNPVA